MDNKLFLSYLHELKQLQDKEYSIKNAWRKFLIRRKMKKLMKQAAQKQADLVYQQTLDLYENIINTNLH